MEIDISNELTAFEKHLRNNERVILSAKFGDGKTYFLDEFKKKFRTPQEGQTQYEFITLYPINYQVSDNKEIFEYIKRDILIQLILKGMVPSECTISESMYFQNYVLNGGATLLQDLLQIMPSLGIMNESPLLQTFMTGFAALKFLANQKKKYREYKENIAEQDDIAVAELFCQKFKDEKGGCYEVDLITEIIIQSIKKIKDNNPTKEVVLIIEDMDRLDPAHLFRILNVFSAHLDRYNLYSHTRTLAEETIKNKFGFSRIITVFDYDGAKNIFNHFYGNGADFTGYMSKYTTSNVFHYSIKKVALKAFENILHNECKVEPIKLQDKPTVNEKFYVYEKIQSLTLRDIEKIIQHYKINLSNQGLIAKYECQVYIENPLTRLVSILCLLNYSKEKIKKILLLTLKNEALLNCCGDFLLLHKGRKLEIIRYKMNCYRIDSEINQGVLRVVGISSFIDVDYAVDIEEREIEVCIEDAFNCVRGL